MAYAATVVGVSLKRKKGGSFKGKAISGKEKRLAALAENT
jgi:hypothetical protein